jgi:hypothetical protein
VHPVVSGAAARPLDAERFAATNREQFAGSMMNAIGKAITDHQAERNAAATTT